MWFPRVQETSKGSGSCAPKYKPFVHGLHLKSYVCLMFPILEWPYVWPAILGFRECKWLSCSHYHSIWCVCILYIYIYMYIYIQTCVYIYISFLKFIVDTMADITMPWRVREKSLASARLEMARHATGQVFSGHVAMTSGNFDQKSGRFRPKICG